MAQKKKRLDDLLVEFGFYADTEQAKRAILAHEVKLDTAYIDSPAYAVKLDEAGKPQQELSVKGRKPYVSRGGYKLQGALDNFNIDVAGKNCIDIGSSTGGFTDCLLQAGANSVTCVDVCYGQLAWELRCDDRVKVFEQTNIKDVQVDQIGGPFDVLVADLSFIGLASLAAVISELCHKGSIFVGLVKPQFESKHGESVKGIVLDENVRLRTVEEVKTSFKKMSFEVKGTCESPIKGRAGNVEYLVYMIYK